VRSDDTVRSHSYNSRMTKLFDLLVYLIVLGYMVHSLLAMTGKRTAAATGPVVAVRLLRMDHKELLL
jgi:hypothetical protein